MHSAKGLEFDVVYVIHAADGNIPTDMATGTAEGIEEERRLFYVACTRAKNQLYVAHPLRYYTQPHGRSDRHGYAQRTRFLTERRHAALRRDAGEPEVHRASRDAGRTRDASRPRGSATACARFGSE